MPEVFQKKWLSGEPYESAGIADINQNGHLDIVSGAWWYEGPTFSKKHRIWTPPAIGEYHDDFSTIFMDVTGNGFPDIITGGFFGEMLYWLENPGNKGGEWTVHEIDKCGNIETTRAWDIDGDGHPEIVPNLPGGPLIAYKLIRDENGRGMGEFETIRIHDGPQGHGLGFGDITGNGRGDFVFAHGWLEAPENTWVDNWTFHKDFDLKSASVPIIVADVTGNGRNDLIVGQAHEYGLDWWEQKIDSCGTRTWVKHPIDPDNSQYHDLIWADIDGDGAMELITGKRYYAHCGDDPGADDPIGLYYFKWNGESFTKNIIDYGKPGKASGTGIHFAVADLTGNNKLDIIAPGKEGLFLFSNQSHKL